MACVGPQRHRGKIYIYIFRILLSCVHYTDLNEGKYVSYKTETNIFTTFHHIHPNEVCKLKRKRRRLYEFCFMPSSHGSESKCTLFQTHTHTHTHILIYYLASYMNIIWKLCNVFVRQSGKKGLMRGGRIDGCSNMTTRPHIHRSLSVTSWPNTRRLSFHSLRTLQISHQLTFFCFQSSNQR